MRRRTTPSGRPPPAWRGLVVLLPGLPARADPGEAEDVVWVRAEDRVAEVVLRGVEAMEVLGAVRRPARPDEQRHERELLEPELLQLRRDRVLLVAVERGLPLRQERRCLVVLEVDPVAGVRPVLTRRDVRVVRHVRVEEPVRRAL